MRFLLPLLLLALLGQCACGQTPTKVTGLPGSSAINETMYAGYIEVDPQTDSNLFYWFFESRQSPSTDPVVLWMTGGPGCSSELAILFENGPFTVDSNMNLSPNPNSWNSIANMLYIDQPYGTGFSYSKGSVVKNETEMAADMYIFLTKWFQTFPQYQGRDFYIVGESFGGHYVPALSVKILQSTNTFNLRGIGIGNGWVDPYIQYGSYGTFAYQNKLISASEYAKLNSTYATCQKYLNEGDYNIANMICSQLMDGVLTSAGNINIYNIDLPCVGGSLCYNFNDQTKYMNLAGTQKALGVKTQWSTCASTQITEQDIISSFRQDLPTVLAAGVPVVAYKGMLDLICNYVGGLEWTVSMPWSGQSDFDAAPANPWVVDGSTVAYVKHTTNFTFVEVASAGHMVPHDQPATALAILSRIIDNDWSL